MKKVIIEAAAGVTLIVMVAASGAYAGQIQPAVTVSGVLNGVCRAGTSGAVTFTIDPSLAGPIPAAATNATVFCTKGTPFTVTAASANKGGSAASCASSGGGITGTLKDGANLMDYTFTCGVDGTAGNTGTGKGHGSGMDVNLGIAASITAASYQNAAVSSSYADTLTLTITY
jgi:spore coat protein U-like protein